MADFRDGAIAAFAGLENSIMELRSVSLLLSNLEQDRKGEARPDGTWAATYQSWEEANAEAFLILDIERRVIALRKEFDACLDVWKAGAATNA